MPFSSAGLTSAERRNAVSALPLRHLRLCLARASGGVTYTAALHTCLWGGSPTPLPSTRVWGGFLPICDPQTVDFNRRPSTYFQHPCFLAAFRPLSKMLNATSTSGGLLGTFLGTHSAKKEIPVDKHILNSSVRL